MTIKNFIFRDLPDSIYNNLIEKFSVFNGKYLEITWSIYDFLLREKTLFKLYNDNKINLLETLIEKYRNSIDLTSPHVLASLTKSFQNLIYLTLANQQVNLKCILIFRVYYF